MSNKTVFEMEAKLPREEKLEWARQCYSLPGHTKFEKFKEFLQQRKSVMEVMESMGEVSVGNSSVGNSSKCGYCGKRNHDESSCYAKQRDQGQPNVKKGVGGCAICGDKNHWKNKCPDKDTLRDRKAHGGKSNLSKAKPRGVQGLQGVQWVQEVVIMMVYWVEMLVAIP